ncbi:MAG: helix-hairpin-helix domain-containing protein [Bacteroidaceae bacterium]|nr:helix-hairpin-helix domain-containing protein [Bacteroidaceae bacterium]
MWKDFFYYSQSERRAVVVLMTLIALFVAGLVWLPDVKKTLVVDMPERDSIGLKNFEREMQVKSFRRKERADSAVVKSPVVLNPFDPNTADSIELSSLGLSRLVVRNILKYRQKGGHFRTVESFARIYGLKEKEFEKLKPYIRIVRTEKSEPVKVDSIASVAKVEKKVFKYPEGTQVDVNSADTTELKKIPGIGSGIAKAIVGYRKRLGGFYSLEQLAEIKYVTPELFEWFKLEETSVRKLEINKSGLDKLRLHPYINFYQAKVIVEHRRKKGPIKSLSQLALYEEFTEKDLRRLSAYISFD